MQTNPNAIKSEYTKVLIMWWKNPFTYQKEIERVSKILTAQKINRPVLTFNNKVRA